MASLRRTLNRTVASLIPPIGTLITERDKLRAENSRLLGEADRLTSENAKLAARLSADETPSDIRDEFYSRGFAIMRNAIAPRRVDWFLAECLQPTAIFWSARSLTDADVTAMNSYYGVPWTADNYNFCRRWNMFTDRMLRFATDGTHNFFELLSERIWSAIASLSPGPFAPSVVAHSRSIDPHRGKTAYGRTTVEAVSSTAVSLHYDRLYHDEGNFMINVWCPLQDVGEKFGRPSLSFIPAPLRETVPLFRNNADLLKPTIRNFNSLSPGASLYRLSWPPETS